MEQPRRKTLDRELGLAAVMAISMGAMLGSGIFVLPGLAVAKSGPSLALAYLVSALIVLPAALAKCELATALPKSGGTYLFVDRSLGPMAGTVVGLGTWFSLVFKSAFALVGLGGYFLILVPSLPSKVALGLAIGVGLVILNLLGVKKSSGFQNAVVAAALVGLLAFAVGAAPHVEPERFQGFFGISFGSLLSTAGFVFVSFAGVTKIASVAEEVQQPDRNIPLGILLSLAIVTVIYVLISLVLVGVMPLADLEHQATPLAAATSHVWGPGLGAAMSLLAVLTLTSMANSGLLSSSRYPLAMSRDKLLPDALSGISQRFRTPTNSILFTGVLLLSLVALVPVEELAKLASAFQLLLFAAVNVALIVVRESGARWYKPSFRIPLYPLVPLLGIVGSLVLLGTMGALAWAGALGIVGGGLGWYFVYARGRVQRWGAAARLYGERRRISQRINRQPSPELTPPRSGVMVPIFDDDDETIDDLLPLASMLAGGDCEIDVLRVEEVPEQLALGDLEEVDPATTRIAAHVASVAREQGIQCAFEDVLTHHIKHAIYERATAQATNWIVRSWPRRSPWRFVPDPTAWFIHHPPCNLLLFRDIPGQESLPLARFQRVVVLAEPGPHDALVIHVADRFAQATGADVTFVYLAPEDASEEDEQGLRDYHRSLDPLFPTEVGEAQIVRSSDDLAATIQLCQDYDLLVLGAPPQSEARGLFRGSFEDQVTERVPCAVLRVMAVRGLPHASLSFHEGAAAPAVESPGIPLAEALNHIETATQVSTKKQLFKSIADGLEARLGAPLIPSIEEQLWEREHRQTTALGQGVAVPHFTHNALEEQRVELWLLDEPLDYKAPGGEKVDMVFVMIGPPSERKEHLRILASLGELAQRGVLDRLRQVPDLPAAQEILRSVGRA